MKLEIKCKTFGTEWIELSNSIADVKDVFMDVSIEEDGNKTQATINKEDAQLIINHLKEQFGI